MLDWLEQDFLLKVDKLKNKNNILHFSCGADSVASYLKLKEHGINPILVYHYYIKGLPMVQNYIDWFEKKFNEKIYQFPSTVFSHNLDNIFYQAPAKHPVKFRDRSESFRNRIGTQLEEHTKEGFDQFLIDVVGGEGVIHLGLRYTDGIRRYQHLMKHGCSFGNKFYPIASFQIKDIQNILERNNCLLPIEYSLWGLSFESPRAWNINLIKEHCPVTYDMICYWFPLVGSQGLRKFAKHTKWHKQRITQYGKYAMKKEMAKVW